MADDDGDDQDKPGKDEPGKGEDERPTLRVVPLHPEPYLAPQWVFSGEAVVSEFLRRHSTRFYFIDVAGEWREWTGAVWARDECRRVNRLMAELCRDIGAAKKKTVRSKVEGAAFIAGAAHRVRDELAGPIDVFDRADVLNTPGARVSLNGAGAWSGEPNRREDFCSKVAAVAPVRGACPLWFKFLARVTNGQQELIDYLQRVAGYCCSLSTAEQAFFFAYGTGANGKGTFLNTIKGILGGYGATASLELFTATKFEGHPEELAALRGTRLVVTAETEKGRAWNEGRIKSMTGGDVMRARFMRQDSFEFSPHCKVVVVGNHKPNLSGTDVAMRRRLHLIPFTVMIPAEERDLHLLAKLRPEWPAILGWMLDGHAAWRKGGLAAPADVTGATSEYFSNQDTLQQWLDMRCTIKANVWTRTSILFESWKAFAEAAGERVGSQKAFTESLNGKGFRSDRQYQDGKQTRGLWGIKIAEPGDDDGGKDLGLDDERAAALPALQTLGPEPLEPCGQCGVSDDKVLRIRNPATGETAAVHRECAPFWFKLR